jgi:putative transposase
MHYDHDGRARFITFCTHNRLPLLTNDNFRSTVIEAIKEVRARTGLKLLGYVIMPNHIHLVLIPPVDGEVGFIIGEIKRKSAREIHRRLKKVNSELLVKLNVRRRGVDKFTFWQKRCFDHNCRSEEVVWTKVKYCHDNPVRWGLVKIPGDWRWSSYNCYYGKNNVVLEIDFEGCPI